jgi:hypothetical protein
MTMAISILFARKGFVFSREEKRKKMGKEKKGGGHGTFLKWEAASHLPR